MSKEVETPLNTEELRRYQRHITLPNFGLNGQHKLKKSKVLVIGAGGLGSPILLYLAAAGVGHLGIVDFDEVDESNLQRQVLYTTNDIGENKALKAKEKLKALNPHTNVVEWQIKLDTENALEIIKEYDLVIDGSDNFQTRYLVNDACVICNKPFIYGSIFRYEGQVAVFNYKDGPNYRDLYPEPPAPESVPNCAEGGVIGVLPGIIGSLQANEAIKMLADIGDVLSGKLFIFDLLSMTNRTIKVAKRPDAPTIDHLINYDEFCGFTSRKTDTTMVKEITVEELKSMRDAGEDFQLIDVREPHEFDIANLQGELIPLGDIPDNTDKIKTDKKVVVHCRSGARSAQAIQFLQQKLGTDNLYNLKGGILAWADNIDPTVQKY
ncbi:molybdopterin-synthase adenylyltransferase MoeB [Fulvivirga sp. RKSG066]|uniref:molybdopterin-synthase adenylyltransferase MoeB n=1 Tax=Fulvivirga aurantia TaxID=2529383 RepID=UPI0012BB5266|nr:molybdopterin-synthase adenylyltransferase MoeB [Fulvivirga aurantia]MTI22736.1 molybdopterin-synthase adenylyltransferase MoeB [Fulvivirga aurantia]